MNERIQELRLKAVDSIPDEEDYIIPDEFVKKFAELIVRECAVFTFKYTSDEKNIQEYNKIGWDLLSGDLRDAIKEHFGVEE